MIIFNFKAPFKKRDKKLVYCKLPQIRVKLFGYIFSPGWLPTLLTLLLLPLLISLGVWQLHRAEEKKQLETEFSLPRLPLGIKELLHLSKQHIRYQRLKVSGYFDNNHHLFLDNQTHNHQVGFHVFTPFVITNNDTWLLIDRGFVAIKNRAELPQIPSVNGPRTVSGLIYLPSKKFILKKDQLTNNWPLLIQSIDLPLIQSRLPKPLYPFYLLLQNGDDVKFIRDWQPVNFPSYRHTGYAMQWFALSALLVILYLFLNFSKIPKEL
jgi:surfeit locus 1 family protein